MNRGKVIYTAGWVVGYVIACVFYIYITQDNGYTKAKYIGDFISLGAVYILAYLLSSVLFSDVLGNYFEKNKMGWTKRAFLSIYVMGFLIAILVTFFDVSFFPFNLFGDNFLSILFSAWTLIAIPVGAGMFIVMLFAEALGVEYS
jgi:hypothetical protein